MSLRVDFHLQIPNLLDYTCRLLRKIYNQQAQVLVLLPPDWLPQLDQALWTFSSLDFIPHCRIDDPLAAVTPLVLSDQPQDAAQTDRALLLNLTSQLLLLSAHVQRVLEVVGVEPDAVAAARARFRHYREQPEVDLHWVKPS